MRLPWVGSSPRVRGKHPRHEMPHHRARLIPACAGKTDYPRTASFRGRAHPRVCGENMAFSPSTNSQTGSSPRVRGKLCALGPGHSRRGLIPACAGKTVICRVDGGDDAAHPRVCGENTTSRKESFQLTGSSPRVRGKQPADFPKGISDRLIPACAGKTFADDAAAGGLGAHPRVCGENGKD